MASWTNLPPFRVLTATSVGRMDQLLEDIEVLSTHTHNGSNGGGASVISILATGTCPCETAEQNEFHIIPFLPNSQSNWDRIAPCPFHPNGGAIKTTANVSASGACIQWAVLLPGQATGGSWVLMLGYLTGSNSGCIAACLGGSLMTTATGVSTLDFYSAADNDASSAALRTSSVSASGTYSLKFKVVGQNTSSSGYHAGITHIGLQYP